VLHGAHLAAAHRCFPQSPHNATPASPRACRIVSSAATNPSSSHAVTGHQARRWLAACPALPRAPFDTKPHGLTRAHAPLACHCRPPHPPISHRCMHAAPSSGQGAYREATALTIVVPKPLPPTLATLHDQLSSTCVLLASTTVSSAYACEPATVLIDRLVPWVLTT
jgi:hypothetical protein